MGSDKFKLYYFDARGLAEPIRIILSYGGATYEEVLFPVSPPNNVIPPEVKALTPFGQVPLLEFDGQVISQSQAITRYLARKYNLVGANELEAARCDEIVDATKDFFSMWQPVILEQDETKKAELKKTATENSKTRFLSKFNELLEANGGHFVGKGLTWADIYAAHWAWNIPKIMDVSGLLDDFPAVQKLIQTVYETPRIKEYIEKRPNTKY